MWKQWYTRMYMRVRIHNYLRRVTACILPKIIFANAEPTRTFLNLFILCRNKTKYLQTNVHVHNIVQQMLLTLSTSTLYLNKKKIVFFCTYILQYSNYILVIRNVICCWTNLHLESKYIANKFVCFILNDIPTHNYSFL